MEENAIIAHRPPDELHSENTSEKTNMDDKELIFQNFIHTERKGIVRMVDTFFSEKYLKDAIITERQVINVQRMQRKITDNDGTTQLVPRQIIIVGFLDNEVPQNIIDV
ncbi:unnamed protein product [Diabrotica balteata]|uniref:Uncharacterized protein n=1 Tax=Diabrotica balteata TaxID=107213 RepID=A0A9N9SXB7_DIABA|nr:unnamed protein product [Diabrotica balteata]